MASLYKIFASLCLPLIYCHLTEALSIRCPDEVSLHVVDAAVRVHEVLALFSFDLYHSHDDTVDHVDWVAIICICDILIIAFIVLYVAVFFKIVLDLLSVVVSLLVRLIFLFIVRIFLIFLLLIFGRDFFKVDRLLSELWAVLGGNPLAVLYLFI